MIEIVMRMKIFRKTQSSQNIKKSNWTSFDKSVNTAKACHLRHLWMMKGVRCLCSKSNQSAQLSSENTKKNPKKLLKTKISLTNCKFIWNQSKIIRKKMFHKIHGKAIPSPRPRFKNSILQMRVLKSLRLRKKIRQKGRFLVLSERWSPTSPAA